jgi:hypothetical protein
MKITEDIALVIISRVTPVIDVMPIPGLAWMQMPVTRRHFQPQILCVTSMMMNLVSLGHLAEAECRVMCRDAIGQRVY